MIYWGYLYAKFNSNQLASPSSLLTFLRACPYIVMCLCVCVCVSVCLCVSIYACLDMYPMRVDWKSYRKEFLNKIKKQT